ncbi:hypothetical protein MYU51_014179 [Penicillium brevicompactum]
MGLSKIFPCCTQPPDEKDPDERPPKMTETTAPSNNAPAVGLPPQKSPISMTSSGPSNNAESPKPEVATKSEVDLDISISRKVWNRAYEELATDGATKSLVEDYMMAVQRANKPSEDASESELRANVARMNNEAEREKLMKQTLESGQKKIYKTSKLTNAVGGASGFVLKFKSVIDLAVGTNPQAALPWAGVCIGLQFMLNPSLEAQANASGLGYVISRIQWYCELTEHMLSRENIVISNRSYEKVLERLEVTVVEMYKALLLYQMKSACSYYQSQGWTFIRNIVSYDDWKGQLDGVKEAEKAVEDDSKHYNKLRAQGQLEDIARNGKGTLEVLTGVHETLREYIASQGKMARGKDYDECLKHLYVEDGQIQLVTIQGQKDDLIPEACEWIFDTEEFKSFVDWSDSSQSQVLWVNGPAGTGKTMLMISIIQKLYDQSKYAPGISNFFFEASQTTKNSALHGLRSLVWLLLIQQPHLISYLVEKHKRSGEAMFKGDSAFWQLIETLKEMLADEKLSPVYLSFDALDECAPGKPSEKELLNLVEATVRASGNGPTKVKWLLSSRPEIGVYNKLKRAKEGAVVELDVTVHKEALEAYVEQKMSQLREKEGYKQTTLDRMSAELSKHEQTTFLWVSLVFKELITGDIGQHEAVAHVSKFPKGLNKTYDRIMKQIDELKSEADREFCKRVLEAACFASRPLSFDEIHGAAGLPPDLDSPYIVTRCGSFLTVHNDIVYMLHHSTGEYLTRYFEENHPGGSPQVHEFLAKQAIIAMSEGLKRNMYKLEPGTESNCLGPPPSGNPLAALQYSCEFWVYHLLQSSSPISDDGPVLHFLEAHFLHWLESLSLLRKLPSALTSIRELLKRTMTTQNKCPKLIAFLQDAERFIMKNLSIMMVAPLQIYGGALIFSPTSCHISKIFREKKLSFVRNVTGVTRDWDPCLQTLDTAARRIIFSPDGKLFASHFTDFNNELEILRVWDVTLGVCVQEFRIEQATFLDYDLYPNYHPLYPAWLTNSKALIAVVSASVRILDIATGSCRYESLHPHVACMNMDLSPDGKYMALVLDDKVQIWNTSNWTYKRTLAQDGEYKTSAVCFAPDSKSLASMSLFGPLKIWNIVDGACKKSFEQDSKWQWDNNLAFSPYDGHLVLLARSRDGLMFWDIASGNHKEVKFKGATGTLAALSGDGNTAAVIDDQTVFLLNLADGVCTHKLIHNESPGPVAFSKDGSRLVTGSGVIRIWDITSPREQSVTGIDEEVSTMCFSPNGKILALGCANGALKLYDPATNERAHTGQCHEEAVWNIVFSPDGGIIATTAGKEVRLWDSSTGQCRRLLLPYVDDRYGKNHRTSHFCTAFSPDGTLLAIITSARSLEAWDTATGEPREDLKLFGQPDLRWIAFSKDGTIFATASRAVQVWDIATKSRKQELLLPGNPMSPQFKHSEEWLTCIALSPNGQTLVTGSYVNASQTSLSFRGTDRGVVRIPRIRVWDILTGNCKQIVDVDFDVSDLTFSENEQSIKTNMGVFEFSSGVLAKAPTSELSRSTLYFDHAWVRRGLEKRLWMPPDYSLSIAATYQNNLVLKGIHGQLVHVDLSDD